MQQKFACAGIVVKSISWTVVKRAADRGGNHGFEQSVKVDRRRVLNEFITKFSDRENNFHKFISKLELESAEDEATLKSKTESKEESKNNGVGTAVGSAGST